VVSQPRTAIAEAHIPDADFQIILSAEQMLKRPNSVRECAEIVGIFFRIEAPVEL